MTNRSPTAQAQRLLDQAYRDTEHSATLQREGDRKRREPTGGVQPVAGSQPKL